MWQPLLDYLWLGLAALVAGGINALAGGGTLLTFPALERVLLSQHGSLASVFANGTSTVALVPASYGSAWGFRRETSELRGLLAWLVPPSVLGGVIGALLLVWFPKQFTALVPWLILTATLLFTLQPLVARRLTSLSLKREQLPGAQPATTQPSLVGMPALLRMIALQFFISVYGGYFGAGIGILMLSGLAMMGLSNMHQMNGLKSVLASIINSVAIVVFMASQKVVWQYALVMMATSLVGGYLAAHYSRRIPGKYVRWFVVAVGFLLAGWYFSKTYVFTRT
jgi:uncharacterized membrane protein YfcA